METHLGGDKIDRYSMPARRSERKKSVGELCGEKKFFAGKVIFCRSRLPDEEPGEGVRVY